MTTKSLITVVIWMVVLLLGVNLARALVLRSPATSLSREIPSAGPVVVTPYTVLFDLSRQNSTRSASGTAVKLIALRGDGSLVQQLEVLGGQAPVSSRLIHLSSGTIITTNDILERKYTRAADASVRGKLRDPRSRCLMTLAGTSAMKGESIEANDVVAGHETVRIKGNGITFWFAPQLGCAELKSRFQHPSGDVIESTVTSVTPGEPAPSLFEVEQLAEVPREGLAGR